MTHVAELKSFQKLLFTLIVMGLAFALAHAVLVIVTLEVNPTALKPQEPFTLKLHLQTAMQIPVEDAKILVELRPKTEPQRQAISSYLTETEPGMYEASLILPNKGVWDAFFRDQTFSQEEATAHIDLNVGAEAIAPIEFIFPPTATGPSANNLRSWLIWVIALPIIAGIAVTVLVLMQDKMPATEDNSKPTP